VVSVPFAELSAGAEGCTAVVSESEVLASLPPEQLTNTSTEKMIKQSAAMGAGNDFG
jgi:hypothetical protein